MLKVVIFTTIILGAMACRQAPKPVDTAVAAPEEKPALPATVSPETMAALMKDGGKTLPDSLWGRLTAPSKLPKPERVQFLTGNLDNDQEAEVILWCKEESSGRLWCFDLQDGIWQCCDEVPLDFTHGDFIPFLEPRLRAVVIPYYGWGSSFRSENIRFYRLKAGKLAGIWDLIREEYCGYIPPLPYNRKVAARYRVDTDSTARVQYTYQLSDRDTGKRVWKKVFSIRYKWNPAVSRLDPGLPPGALEPFDADCPFSEEYFEAWLSDDLEALR